MTPEQAVQEARTGEPRPVYLVLGEERYLQSIVVSELRKAVVGGGAPGFNEDQYDAGDSDPDRALSDGAQSLFPDQFAKLVQELRLIAAAIDRSVAPSPAGSSAGAGAGTAGLGVG